MAATTGGITLDGVLPIRTKAEEHKMTIRRTIIALVVLLGATVTMTGQAFAAFEQKELENPKEGGVTFTATEAGIVFKIKGKEKTQEVTCATGKGEGAVMEKSGYSGGSAKLEEPASGPAGEAEQLALQVKLESCKGALSGKEETDKVNATSCQVELFDENETGGQAKAYFSLRGLQKEHPCTMTIEAGALPKCKIEIKTAGERENEELQSVGLRNGKEVETEIEAGSEVKGMNTSTTGECSLPEKTETNLSFKKAIVIKGAKLVLPVITVSDTEGEQMNGRTFDFPNTTATKSKTQTIRWTSHQNGTEFKSIMLTNIGAAVFAKDIDNCSGNTFNLNGFCDVIYKFSPGTTGLFSAITVTAYAFGFFSWTRQITDTLVGRGV
ncbi:MAG TPA: hypothetical protein VGY76_12140 [Solirubrobacteraceae bacterium]|nr:hypothetical protein [Solirubrobacteraceae bacterium]